MNLFKRAFNKTKNRVTIFMEDPILASMRVNCIHLAPAKEDGQHPHCDMGDGREGDCPVYLRMLERECCIHRTEKFRALPKEDILKKVEKKEQDSAYIRRCVDAHICPDCGHELRLDYWEDSEFTDGICDPCQKSYIVD